MTHTQLRMNVMTLLATIFSAMFLGGSLVLGNEYGVVWAVVLLALNAISIDREYEAK